MPVTSYIKMVDIWMLFTMTIPFLEVVYHTSNEISKQTVDVRVKPNNGSEEKVMPNNNRKAVFRMMTKRLWLPISSLFFTLIFWVVGIIKSYSFDAKEDASMSKCLTNDLDL